MMSKNEIRQEIKNLETLLEFHSTYGVIKDSKEYEEHINNIIDMIIELKGKLEEFD
jgi:predicted GNAT family N-acyltransferase